MDNLIKSLLRLAVILIICANLHILADLQIDINRRLDLIIEKQDEADRANKSVEKLLQTVIEKASDKYGVDLE